MNSLWQASTSLPPFSQLKEDIQTDVLIIGGGLTGILCAEHLARKNVPYLLVEADRLCCGTSGNTTAKITAQHGLIYHKLLSIFGAERTKLYYQANAAALDRYRALCRTIDCDWTEEDNYVYSVDRPQRLDAELKAACRLGIPLEFAGDLPLPFQTAGAVCLHGQAQFHPLKFIRAILPGLHIYEHTPIRAFDGTHYHTDLARISAKKVITATRFPIFNKHGGHFIKLHQHRSYVLALDNPPQLKGMYMDERSTGLSMRRQGPLLLLGGGSHRTGAKGGGWTELNRAAERFFPDSTVTHRWAAQDCMPLDHLPYIGRYSRTTPDLFVATGFQKWGFTTAMLAASLLCDLVLGEQNPLEDLFSPSRSLLHPRLAQNMFHSLSGLLTPTRPRCPHMGCALKWNPQERSWDCPCHGSRFSETGVLLSDPATGDLNVKKTD